MGRLRHLGQSLLASYAYNNLDIDLKHSIPTAEQTQDTLAHLPTMTMLSYHPSVNLESLDYSKELWEKCQHNLNARPSSDWHGYAKPAGFPGKGQPGTGLGGNLCTLVKPVPPERVAGFPACDLSRFVM